MKRAGSLLESTAKQPKTDGEENIHIIPDELWLSIFKRVDITRYYADMHRYYHKSEWRERPNPNLYGYLPLAPRLICKKFYNIINQYTQIWRVIGSIDSYNNDTIKVKDNRDNFLSIVNNLSNLKRLILGWNSINIIEFDKPTFRCLQGITVPVEVLTISYMYIDMADLQIRFAKFLKNACQEPQAGV